MTAVDMAASIVPRSDQLNAEDLLAGPRTVTITGVRRGSADQPVDIHLKEFDRPFKPSKTMRRIIVAAWGVDSSTYIGRRMTIYRDPDVKFGGLDVGGIRISHLSNINQRLRIALTVTRGKRAPYVVEPLTEPAPRQAVSEPPGAAVAQLRARMLDLFRENGFDGVNDRRDYIVRQIEREVESSKDLTADEIAKVTKALEDKLERDTAGGEPS